MATDRLIQHEELYREVVCRAERERSLETSSDPHVLALRLIEQEQREQIDPTPPRHDWTHPKKILENVAASFSTW